VKHLLTREFNEGDQKEVKNLILAGLQEYFGTIDYSLNPDLNDIYSHYLAQGGIFLVATYDEHIVGAGGYCITENPKVCQIVRVSVHKDYRRQGIAERIVRQLIAKAQKERFDSVIVETTSTWEKPKALYKKLGFREYKQTSEDTYFMLSLK
jgi:ribosomal protein S18 acetylase RimI-like enzyme